MSTVFTLRGRVLSMLSEAALARGLTQDEALYMTVMMFWKLTQEERRGGHIAIVHGQVVTRVYILGPRDS